MKSIALLLLALVLLTGTAFAQEADGSAVDVSLNYASEPADGFGGALGVEAGASIAFERMGLRVSIDPSIQTLARASVGYYVWDRSTGAGDKDFRRIPIFVGGRFVVSTGSPLKVYGDLGLELSADRQEFPDRSTDSEFHLGVRPQAGIIYPLTPQLTLGANVAWHIITDSYFTLGATLGFNLP